MTTHNNTHTMPEHIFPATHVVLPSEYEGERAAFYLAVEEYIASYLPEGSYLFTWQLAPTVVMGRNQDAEAEIDLAFCKAEGIDVIRRKSGGGSIFADHGNIMTSLVTREGAVEELFGEYAKNMAGCLKGLGAEVEVSGRNDICMKGGGKICGNAFYHMARRNIVHGTMLYDTDARRMQGALTPERAKLLSKGVKSVESRIALLKDALPESTGVRELRQSISEHLCKGSISLTEEDISRIREIESGYYAPTFLWGKARKVEVPHRCQARIEGCGTIAMEFEVRDGMVVSVALSGDYFELGDAHALFSNAFVGCTFTKENLTKHAREHSPNRAVRGLETAELCSLIGTMFSGNETQHIPSSLTIH